VGGFYTLVFFYLVRWVSRGGGRYSGFIGGDGFCCLFSVGELWGGRGGDGARDVLRTLVQNFFNRSPITLKFGAEKLERES